MIPFLEKRIQYLKNKIGQEPLDGGITTDFFFSFLNFPVLLQ